MESILRNTLRKFNKQKHIKNVLKGKWVNLFDEDGNKLTGIRGRIGVNAMKVDKTEIGVDLIEMSLGSRFPLHVHEGDHVLYGVSGRGLVSVDGIDHLMGEGDTVFIPAEYPHGVKTIPHKEKKFLFLAFGHPHKHVSAKDRMRLV